MPLEFGPQLKYILRPAIKMQNMHLMTPHEKARLEAHANIMALMQLVCEGARGERVREFDGWGCRERWREGNREVTGSEREGVGGGLTGGRERVGKEEGMVEADRSAASADLQHSRPTIW